MIIRRVELINFLSHKHTSVDFDTGIVAIVGPNGAGKSSIIDAIAFTLFGFHSRSGGRSRSNKSLIRLGASYAVTRVTFEVGGRLYQAERRLEASGRASAALYEIDGSRRKLIARDVRSVEAEVEKLLGVKREVARVALIAQQGEIAEILETSRRKEYVHRLLGLDVMEKLFEKLRSVQREWQLRLENLRGQYEMLKARATQLEQKLREYSGLEEELRRLEEELRRLEELEERLRAERDKLLSSVAQAELIEKQLEDLEEKIAALREEEAEVRERLEVLDYNIGELREELSRNPLSGLIARAVEKGLDARGALALLEEASRIIHDLQSIGRQRSRVKEEVARLEEELRRAREVYEKLPRLQELEEKIREYHAARRMLEEKRKKAAELEKKIRTMQDELEAVAREALRIASSFLRGLEHSIDAHEDRVSFVEEVESRLSNLAEELTQQLETLRERLESIKREKHHLLQKVEEIRDNIEKLASAQGRCPLCGRPLREHERRALIHKLRREKEDVEQRIMELEAEEQRLEARLEELERKLRSLEEVRRRVLEVRERLRGLRERLSDALEEYRRAKEEARELHITVVSLSGITREYEELNKLIRSTPPPEHLEKALSEKLQQLEELENEMEEFYDKLSKIAAALGVDDIGTLAEATAENVRKVREALDALLDLESERRVLEERLQQLESEIRKLEEKKAKLEEQLEQLKPLIARKEEVEEKLRDVNKALLDVRERVGSVRQKLREREEALRELEGLRVKLRELEARIEKVKRMLGDIQRLRSVFGKEGLPKVVRLLARKIIEDYIREILSQFNIEFMDVRITEDYDVVLVAPSGLEKSFRMLSGGERTAIALAFRIAFARMLAGRGRINTLILDEPTLFLDEHRKRELINILRYGWRGSGTILPQLIIVTHDREIEDAADQVIEVEKVEGISRVKVVTPSSV